MTEQQQIWFDKLAKDREDSAKHLKNPLCVELKIVL